MNAEHDRVAYVVNKVRCQTNRDNEKGRAKWIVQNTPVCRPFWEHAHSVGHSTVDKLLKLIRAVAQSPPRRGPRIPGVSHKKQYMMADARFLELYKTVAEPLA